MVKISGPQPVTVRDWRDSPWKARMTMAWAAAMMARPMPSNVRSHCGQLVLARSRTPCTRLASRLCSCITLVR
jgi:hypothetical protein